MHDRLFAQAATPPTPHCLGVRLKPFSLGHHIRLAGLGSSYLTPSPKIADLPAAVLVCCQTWREWEAMRTDWLLGLKLRLWKRRQRKMDGVRDAEIFEAYLEQGSLEMPLSNRPPQPGYTAGRRLGSPLVAMLEVFLRAQLGLSRADAMDAPFGHAKCLYAAWCEGQGTLDVRNAHEAAVDDAFARMRAEDEAKALKGAVN